MLNGSPNGPTPALSDKEALVLASKGDPEAFGVLYERYAARIYTYIFYRTGSGTDAEDLTARVFMRALRHIPKYQDRGVPFTAWLYRIAHNLVANWHRDGARRPETPLDEALFQHSTGQGPEHALLQNERNEALLRLVRRLPPDRQQLLILKFVENYSNAEIGRVMGRTEGAVKSLYHRTLLALRDLAGKGFF
ncbi:MAG TPA: sigma-70 family RNA polymerase sigma factor [Anaerolineales bacterium]|nr:sigma-70 family RNA polymerase sigma factor [Anaerolineales bacterium]